MTVKAKGIRIIVDNDLCISCGACVHGCFHENIELRFNAGRGKWDAFVKDSAICQSCSDRPECLAVCPHFDIDYVELAGSHENGLLGRIQHVYNGYAKDPSLRYRSSSGGFVRELSRTLLARQEIQGVISLAHERGLDYSPQIVTNVEEMHNSIYHNINYERAIRLIQENTGRYLLVGLPCQVTGVELFLRREKKASLRKRIYGKVALMCGYTFDRKNIQAFAFYNGFPLSEVTYREGGRYRKTRLRNGSREIVVEAIRPRNLRDKINNWLCFDQVLVQTGCLYCVDHLGYCADLVVGDAWQKRYEADSLGTNMIISRTDLGEKMIAELRAFHFEDGTLEEVIEAQSARYALGALGEGMGRVILKGHYYSPHRKRTDHPPDLVTHALGPKDLMKIRIVKRLLREEKFRLAKWLYILLEARGLLMGGIRG